MNSYVVFVICAIVSAIATGICAKAHPTDNERHMGAAIAVFFGLASIALPIMMTLRTILDRFALDARPLEERRRG